MEKSAKMILYLLCVCLFVSFSLECGPGPAFSRLKILKPMVLYQRLPDVDEESISGSGMFRRIVTENSKEFKELVQNFNKDIVFEGGDGKRIMTKRCREKLDKLAKLVKHEWPDVKLRVIEAYDKYGQHPPNSLHYEARAVDITTSDRDKSKIGNLGSLAYQAGFDWVYYESHSYIHASVVSENDVSLKQADCFPSSAKVHSWENGPIEMEQLNVGDHILTKKYINGRFQEFYTEVLGFLDHVIDIKQPYLVFKTETGLSLATTKSHLVYTMSKNISVYHEEGTFQEASLGMKMKHHGDLLYHRTGKTFSAIESIILSRGSLPLKNGVMEKVIDIKPAYSITNGDRLIMLRNSSGTYSTKITKITLETRKGAIAPLTEEGNFIVNNILVSCYAKISDAKLAHTAFMPYRYTATLLPPQIRQNYLDWYVAFLRKLNDWLGIVFLR